MQMYVSLEECVVRGLWLLVGKVAVHNNTTNRFISSIMCKVFKMIKSAKHCSNLVHNITCTKTKQAQLVVCSA